MDLSWLVGRFPSEDHIFGVLPSEHYARLGREQVECYARQTETSSRTYDLHPDALDDLADRTVRYLNVVNRKAAMLNEIKANIPSEPMDGTVVLAKDGMVWHRHGDTWVTAGSRTTFSSGSGSWVQIVANGPVLILTNEETSSWLNES